MTKTIDDYNKAVGINLRKKRTEHGKSQHEIGDLLGITFQQIQKYERAKNRISAGTLMYLAKYFNCHISEFFDMSEGSEAILLDDSA